MIDQNNSKSLLAILVMVFVFFIILVIFAVYTVKDMKDSDDIKTSVDSDDAQIAVIEISEVITSSKEIVEKLIKAEEDKEIKAIIVRIDSPGGTVGPTQEIYEEILRIDEEKPVYASLGSIAASGGYYIAAATRKIYSNAGTLTGSIGVIMNFMDSSKLLEFAKLVPNTVKAGKFKDVGSGERSMTEEERALLEGTVNSVHEQFKNDILKRRKEKITKDFNEIAQGQIFSGQEALSLGLVDAVAGLWAAGRAIHTELKLKGEFKLRFLKDKKKNSLWDLAESLEESITDLKLGNILGQKTLMYLYAPQFSGK